MAILINDDIDGPSLPQFLTVMKRQHKVGKV